MKAAFSDGGARTTMGLPSSRSSRRLLFLIGQLGLGGSERQLFCLLERIDKSRFEIAVFVWNFRQDDPYVARIKALGVPLFGSPSRVSRLSKMQMFRQFVRQWRPNVIHSYSFHTNFAASWATVGTKAIAFGSVRSDFARAKKNCGLMLGILSAVWPRSQIFNSVAAADDVRRSRSFFVPGKVFVVCNGLDLERYRMVTMPNGKETCIAGVGSLMSEKRWDKLLLAGCELKKRKLDCVIRIAGDGPMRGFLEQQAQELGMAAQIKFLGSIDNIPQFLSNVRFLVHTSDTEGSPNAVMEAMACGRAVVATDAGDVRHLVEDGKTGFVVRRGDDATLVERMVTLITDQDLCRSMGEAGRAKAVREFGLDRLVADTFDAYRAAGWRDA
jgi:glycosyltransferase involved in cell wall biosynthesis